MFTKPAEHPVIHVEFAGRETPCAFYTLQQSLRRAFEAPSFASINRFDKRLSLLATL